jgi:hypothetical protein
MGGYKLTDTLKFQGIPFQTGGKAEIRANHTKSGTKCLTPLIGQVQSS